MGFGWAPGTRGPLRGPPGAPQRLAWGPAPSAGSQGPWPQAAVGGTVSRPVSRSLAVSTNSFDSEISN